MRAAGFAPLVLVLPLAACGPAFEANEAGATSIGSTSSTTAAGGAASGGAGHGGTSQGGTSHGGTSHGGSSQGGSSQGGTSQGGTSHGGTSQGGGGQGQGGHAGGGKANGEACGNDGECTSDACAPEGVCCESPCDATCSECSSGACAPVAPSTPDPAASVPCVGASACDGAGHCKAVKGAPCGGDADCLSGHCAANGVCCAVECGAPCHYAEEGDGSACKLSPAGTTGPKCDLPGQACDAAGACKLAVTAACSAGSQCASGHCASDGVCCAVACSGTCVVCGANGGQSCTKVAPGAPGPGCDGAGQSCDAAGACKLAPGAPCEPNGPLLCSPGTCGPSVYPNESGRCCGAGCAMPCNGCDVNGSCAAMPLGFPDPRCDSVAADPFIGQPSCAAQPAACACSKWGACRLQTGQVCTNGADCVNGGCIKADGGAAGLCN